MLEGYLQTFVHYDQDNWYQLLPLGQHAYNNSTTNTHKMTTYFANYAFHPQTEWITEKEAKTRG